ncbi:hypothetical protein [Streptomyces sirii]|uniref:WXG100-like domain-containing protein n=1 Tax=Streptomyces sirii TaxID=3127701 RepID=UPI003D36F206
MSLMLPDWLEWVLEMLGYDWPTGDEDKMNESANNWREFAGAVEQLQSEGVSAAGGVLSANSGESIEGFSKTWEKFSGNGSGYLDDARTAAELIAFAMDAGSVVIIGMKVAVIAQLAILAAEIIAAQAAAPFTLGLSEIGAAGATQATRLIVRRILKEAREALVEAIVETVKEPAVSALEAMISDAIAQGMNMNFGAQQGFDVGRSLKTGADAGIEAAKNSGQTFTEALRDGCGRQGRSPCPRRPGPRRRTGRRRRGRGRRGIRRVRGVGVRQRVRERQRVRKRIRLGERVGFRERFRVRERGRRGRLRERFAFRQRFREWHGERLGERFRQWLRRRWVRHRYVGRRRYGDACGCGRK